MSAKTKGRGRKAGKTQENVIGALNGDADHSEGVAKAASNGDAGNLDEAAVNGGGKKKQAGGRKQPAAAKRGAAAVAEEKVEPVPAKRGKGRQAKEAPAEPKVEEPEPSVPAKGKRGAARKTNSKADTKATKQEPAEQPELKPVDGPAENGTKPRGKGRGKAAPAPKEEPAPPAEPVKAARGRGTKRDSAGSEKAKASAAETVQTNGSLAAPKDEENVGPSPSKKGRGGRKPAAANKEPEVKPESNEAPEKGKRGRGGKGKAAAPAIVEPEPQTAVESESKPTKRGGKKATTASPAATTTKKRGAAKKVEPPVQEAVEENGGDEELEGDHEEIITAAKRAKPSGKKAPAKSQAKLNSTDTDYSKLDFSSDKQFNFKISSWNVAGLRAWIKKSGLEYVKHEKPDILCLQETKCIPDDIPDEARLPGYHPYWLCKPGGHAGVAIYSKIMPINVEYGLGDEEQDDDGRLLTAEYEKFFLVCVYVPNAGRKLVTLPKRLRWNKLFEAFIQKLNAKKPVIICGDMNVAHNEIDLANPKTNKKNAGFTQEERDGMTDLLNLGYVDTYRHFYPDQERAFTFWAYFMNARAKDVGWRLDYFIVSERFLPKCVDNVIRSKVFGSDHCPITLLLNI
ncbi:unnamed protein product [Hermetia illucens]|uniref:DNA-(apurinic or apyrimidinic site) endonuclease n=1 Tax=Hermetia illucens TaxID=343691 RepID=A0A7R8YV63_HERIL|nr:recombination repair protein 1 isoform X2 [Hermetia illucens]CAD7085456.1 unnamed protein product [Hermetia illucens]